MQEIAADLGNAGDVILSGLAGGVDRRSGHARNGTIAAVAGEIDVVTRPNPRNCRPVSARQGPWHRNATDSSTRPATDDFRVGRRTGGGSGLKSGSSLRRGWRSNRGERSLPYRGRPRSGLRRDNDLSGRRRADQNSRGYPRRTRTTDASSTPGARRPISFDPLN